MRYFFLESISLRSMSIAHKTIICQGHNFSVVYLDSLDTSDNCFTIPKVVKGH